MSLVERPVAAARRAGDWVARVVLRRRHEVPDASGKLVLVTGGNSGIGRATALLLARAGAHVVITARDHDRGERALAELRDAAGTAAVDLLILDLASFADVRRFAGEYLERYERLDVLVNNAGVTLSERTLTEDGCERTWQVNHLGPFLLTRLLLDRLRTSAPARVVNVASVAHRQAGPITAEDLTSPDGDAGLRVYARTKLANVLFTRALARRLEGSGVEVYAVHPGTVRTRFALDGDMGPFFTLLIRTARPWFLSPEQGASAPARLAAADDLGAPSGTYFELHRPSAPGRRARNDELAERLWAISEELVADHLPPPDDTRDQASQ